MIIILFGKHLNGVSSRQTSSNSIKDEKEETIYMFVQTERQTDRQTNRQTESKTDNNRLPSRTEWRSRQPWFYVNYMCAEYISLHVDIVSLHDLCLSCKSIFLRLKLVNSYSYF